MTTNTDNRPRLAFTVSICPFLIASFDDFETPGPDLDRILHAEYYVKGKQYAITQFLIR